MKKSIYPMLKTGFVFLLLCLVAACSSDDNTPVPEPTPKDLIIGKWYVMKITKADGSIHEPANDCEKQSYYKFDDENEVTSVNFYLIDGDCLNSIGGGEYLLTDDGKKLIVTASDGVTTVIEILTLNKTNLELKLGGDTVHLKK